MRTTTPLQKTISRFNLIVGGTVFQDDLLVKYAEIAQIIDRERWACTQKYCSAAVSTFKRDLYEWVVEANWEAFSGKKQRQTHHEKEGLAPRCLKVFCCQACRRER